MRASCFCVSAVISDAPEGVAQLFLVGVSHGVGAEAAAGVDAGVGVAAGDGSTISGKANWNLVMKSPRIRRKRVLLSSPISVGS